MNSAPVSYKEYNTVDLSGNGMNTPASNVIEFTHSTGNKKMETILTEEEAKEYALDKFFTNWDPASIAAQATVETGEQKIDAEAFYLIENNGEFIAIVKGSNISTYTTGTVRKANARGGFGEPIDISNVSAIGCIYAVDTEGRTPVIHDVLGRRLSSLKKGINIVNGIKIVK